MAGRTHPERGKRRQYRDTRDAKNRGRKFDTAAELLRSRHLAPRHSPTPRSSHRKPKAVHSVEQTKSAKDPQSLTDHQSNFTPARTIDGIEKPNSDSDMCTDDSSESPKAQPVTKPPDEVVTKDQSNSVHIAQSNSDLDIYTDDSSESPESPNTQPVTKPNEVVTVTKESDAALIRVEHLDDSENQDKILAQSHHVSKQTVGEAPSNIGRPRATPIKLLLTMPGYKWSNNSCWIDCSLEVIFVLIMRDYPSFVQRMRSVSINSGLHVLVQHLKFRNILNQEINARHTNAFQLSGIVTRLQKSRDAFRKELSSRQLTKGLDNFDSPFVGDPHFCLRLHSSIVRTGMARRSTCVTSITKRVTQSIGPSISPCVPVTHRGRDLFHND